MRKKDAKQSGTLEVVFILDRSGSMSGLEEDTIGGFNAMLEKQLSELKKQQSELNKQQSEPKKQLSEPNKQQSKSDNVIWSTVLFNQAQQVIHDRLPIRDVKPLTEEEYYVCGSTALLDAVGRAIHHIRRTHKFLKKNAPEKTLFIITTDGMENSSTEYSQSLVKQMIEEQQEHFGWEFIFLGADIDAVSEAGRLGIRASRAARYMHDERGVRKTYEAMGDVMCDMAMMHEYDESRLDGVRRDYAKRGERENPSEITPSGTLSDKSRSTMRRSGRKRRNLKDYLE